MVRENQANKSQGRFGKSSEGAWGKFAIIAVAVNQFT